MKNPKLFDQLNKPIVIAVIRGVYGEKCLKLVSAIFKGGINAMEIPFGASDDKTTLDTIRLISKTHTDVFLGAGTVLDKKLIKKIKRSGAKYIVSPYTDRDIIKCTRKHGLISVAGALTPTEIINALKYGADYVKLFPAGIFGADYVKAVLSPIKGAKILAFGNVTTENAKQFLSCGAVGFGVGDALFTKRLVEEEKFDEITENVKTFLSSLK